MVSRVRARVKAGRPSFRGMAPGRYHMLAGLDQRGGAMPGETRKIRGNLPRLCTTTAQILPQWDSNVSMCIWRSPDMIMASILVGIVAGLTSLVVGLIAGQGFLSAMGLYVLGGMAGMSAVLLLAALRSLTRPRRAHDMALATAQG